MQSRESALLISSLHIPVGRSKFDQESGDEIISDCEKDKKRQHGKLSGRF